MRNFACYIRKNFLINKSRLLLSKVKFRSVSGKLVKQSSQSHQSPSFLVREKKIRFMTERQANHKLHKIRYQAVSHGILQGS